MADAVQTRARKPRAYDKDIDRPMNAPERSDDGVDWPGFEPRRLHHSICRKMPAEPWPDEDE